MDEMLDDTLESLDDNEDELEEEAQEEVNKVLFQITDGKLGVANGKVGAIPVRCSCRWLRGEADLRLNRSRAGQRRRRLRRTRRWSGPSQGYSALELSRGRIGCTIRQAAGYPLNVRNRHCNKAMRIAIGRHYNALRICVSSSTLSPLSSSLPLSLSSSS